MESVRTVWPHFRRAEGCPQSRAAVNYRHKRKGFGMQTKAGREKEAGALVLFFFLTPRGRGVSLGLGKGDSSVGRAGSGWGARLGAVRIQGGTDVHGDVHHPLCLGMCVE